MLSWRIVNDLIEGNSEGSLCGSRFYDWCVMSSKFIHGAKLEDSLNEFLVWAGRGVTPKYQAYGYDMLAIPQPKLASVLINYGLGNHSSEISYHFGWALQSLHPDDSRAEFRPSDQDGTGQDNVVVTADLLVGADGLHSKTRKELENRVSTFTSTLYTVPAGRHLRYTLG